MEGDSRGFSGSLISSGSTFWPAQDGVMGSEPELFCTAKRASYWIYFSQLNNKNEGNTMSK
jgi:hypothetical protein